MKIFFLISLFVTFVNPSFAQTGSMNPNRKSHFVDRVISKIFGNKKQQKMVAPKLADGGGSSLEVTMMPKFYQKRTEPVLNIGLVYYGDFYSDEQLEQVQSLLEHRFELATNSLLKLNVIFRAVLPFKNQIKDFPGYSQPYVSEVERLQRLWYYDNKGMNVVNEIYQVAKSHNMYGKDLSRIDAMAVVTGAQFNGLGFAAGRIAITENPMEIAWALKDGGRVEIQSDAKVVDELIHELGHTLHLGHASDQCFGKSLTYEQTQACCAASENKNDVLSYCRPRNQVDESNFFGFESCNLRIIEEKVIPAMLNGGEWELKNKEKCT